MAEALLPTASAAADQEMSAERLARLGALISEKYLNSGKLPNAQLQVARGGQPVYYFTGGKEGEAGAPLRDDALLRIASTTKPVTSIAFVQLVEGARIVSLKTLTLMTANHLPGGQDPRVIPRRSIRSAASSRP